MNEKDVHIALNAPDLSKASPEIRAYIGKLTRQLLGARAERDLLQKTISDNFDRRAKELYENSGQ